MKKRAFQFIALIFLCSLSFGQNPFVTHMYTADPSARVFNDTLYVFPSHDEDTATWFNMVDWHVFSTTDMKTWTDHGVALSLDDLSWAQKFAWAPDCIEKDGKYYFYFPTDQFHIGVAVGDRPYGPFKDPIGKPLLSKDSPGVICNRDFIDPAVFIDDDGTAYLFAGQNTVNAIKLNPDMVSYDGKVHIIEGTDHFFEASWVHKYNGKYYLSYSGDGKILYAMSDSIFGPYQYTGVILDEVNSGTNHHSIVEYKGNWYLFYHNSDLYYTHNPEVEQVLDWNGLTPYRRSICVDYLYYNEDGTIKKVVPTKQGVNKLGADSTSPLLSKIEWISTTESNPWTRESNPVISSDNVPFNLLVDTTATLHTMDGFGACFNELGWTSLNALPENDRSSILKELFKPDFGANFNICRMPLGANDFSRDWYSYNETEGDFKMKNFSIANDNETLIPFIKSALKQNPELMIWASPWSPPSWMKWNKHYACRIPNSSLAKKFHNNLPLERQGKEGTNMFIQSDKYFKAYALYFSKFIEEYKKQAINISMVMPQNEFNSCQIFPSCTWTAAGLATFIGKYLGPAMEKQQVDLMFGTMERPAEALVDTIINDPLAGKFIKGVGFQWAGKEAISGIHNRYPDMKLYQTEQECGNGKNDWEHCIYAWSLMKHYIKNGASAYLYWNISLAEGGYSRWGWQQNSLISVDTIRGTFRFNHEFYLMKHVSHYVKPGAKFLQTQGSFDDLIAFKNPDKSIVIVAFNSKEVPHELTVKIENETITSTLQPNSFNTILIKH